MIPVEILEYLKSKDVPFILRRHERAVDGQRLAASLHLSGHCVAKSVLVRAGGSQWIVVIPAAEMVDEQRLARELKVDKVELMHESEFEKRFRDCELGAEPPFGKLYGLPVFLDESLSGCGEVVFRAGSHEESIQIPYRDFVRLENPQLGSCTRQEVPAPRWREEQPPAHI